MSLRILIAEDERDVAEIISLGVKITWPECEVFVAGNGSEALALFRQHQPDLAILDIVMPAPDGLEVCAEIRKLSIIPILMLTGRSSTLDKVRALDLGADDFLTKPFDHLELLARLRALLRRSTMTGHFAAGQASKGENAAPTYGSDGVDPGALPADELVIGDLRLDGATRRAYLNGESLSLTSTEYRLLDVLARNAGTVIPHRVLIERVWGAAYAGEEQYIKVFIRRLRLKLNDNAGLPRYIQNEWGIGYRFILPSASAEA